MFADMVVDSHALLLHLSLHDLRYQSHAAAARGARLGATFQGADAGSAAADCSAEIAFRYVIARTDLGSLRQCIDPEPDLGLAIGLRQDQEFRRCRQFDTVEHHLQQRSVFAGVAHHHAAQQVFAAFGYNDFLVDLLALVGELIGSAAGFLTVRVTDAGDVDAHQLELGAHVGAGEFRRSDTNAGVGNRLCQHMPGGDTRHVVAGRYQAEYLAVPQRAFTDRINVRI